MISKALIIALPAIAVCSASLTLQGMVARTPLVARLARQTTTAFSNLMPTMRQYSTSAQDPEDTAIKPANRRVFLEDQAELSRRIAGIIQHDPYAQKYASEIVGYAKCAGQELTPLEQEIAGLGRFEAALCVYLARMYAHAPEKERLDHAERVFAAHPILVKCSEVKEEE